MGDDPDGEVAPPRQPGVNGVRYSARIGYLYYTSTAQQVFMRVPVDPITLDPAGTPEFVAAITDGDDFCVDDEAGFAYVTRHRANTFDRVPMAPRHGGEVPTSSAIRSTPSWSGRPAPPGAAVPKTPAG
jgi:hypothetical protein